MSSTYHSKGCPNGRFAHAHVSRRPDLTSEVIAWEWVGVSTWGTWQVHHQDPHHHPQVPGAQVCKLGAWGDHQHSVASTNKALTIHFSGKLHSSSGFAKIGFRAWRALKSWDSLYLHSTYLIKYTQRPINQKFSWQVWISIWVFGICIFD